MFDQVTQEGVQTDEITSTGAAEQIGGEKDLEVASTTSTTGTTTGTTAGSDDNPLKLGLSGAFDEEKTTKPEDALLPQRRTVAHDTLTVGGRDCEVLYPTGAPLENTDVLVYYHGFYEKNAKDQIGKSGLKGLVAASTRNLIVVLPYGGYGDNNSSSDFHFAPMSQLVGAAVGHLKGANPGLAVGGVSAGGHSAGYKGLESAAEDKGEYSESLSHLAFNDAAYSASAMTAAVRWLVSAKGPAQKSITLNYQSGDYQSNKDGVIGLLNTDNLKVAAAKAGLSASVGGRVGARTTGNGTVTAHTILKGTLGDKTVQHEVVVVAQQVELTADDQETYKDKGELMKRHYAVRDVAMDDLINAPDASSFGTVKVKTRYLISSPDARLRDEGNLDALLPGKIPQETEVEVLEVRESPATGKTAYCKVAYDGGPAWTSIGNLRALPPDHEEKPKTTAPAKTTTTTTAPAKTTTTTTAPAKTSTTTATKTTSSSGGDGSRDVSGGGGYLYRQYSDGSIDILSGPGVQKPVHLTSGAAYDAIRKEIGPFPSKNTSTTVAPKKTSTTTAPTNPKQQSSLDQLTVWAGGFGQAFNETLSTVSDGVGDMFQGASDFLFGSSSTPTKATTGTASSVKTGGTAATNKTTAATKKIDPIQDPSALSTWSKEDLGKTGAGSITSGMKKTAKDRNQWIELSDVKKLSSLKDQSFVTSADALVDKLSFTEDQQAAIKAAKEFSAAPQPLNTEQKAKAKISWSNLSLDGISLDANLKARIERYMEFAAWGGLISGPTTSASAMRSPATAHKLSTAWMFNANNTTKNGLNTADKRQKLLKNLTDYGGTDKDGNKWLSATTIDALKAVKDDDAQLKDLIYKTAIPEANKIQKQNAQAAEGYTTEDKRRPNILPGTGVSNHLIGKAVDMFPQWVFTNKFDPLIDATAMYFGLYRACRDLSTPEHWHFELLGTPPAPKDAEPDAE